MDIKELYKLYQQHPVITTDSRDCPAGSIFIALKGAAFNGNQFAAMALEKGCSYAVIDEPEYKQNDRFILVDDCLPLVRDGGALNCVTWNILADIQQNPSEA